MVPRPEARFSTGSGRGRRVAILVLALTTAATWSTDTYAQRIPWVVLPLAASPIIAVLLCVALGVAARAWLVGLGNTALVILWVVWFWMASNYSTSDWLVWSSIVALGLHSIVLMWFIVLHVLRRARTRNED